jgi:tetratricopeptide (TPR) repeat protein
MDRFDWLEIDSTPLVMEPPTAAEQEADPIAAAPTMPNDGPSFYRAARKMRAAGHMKAAADFYKKAVAFDDKDYAAWVELIDTLVRAGQLEQADAVSQEAHTNFRQVRVLYASRALVLAHRGQFKESLPMSNVSVEGQPQHWYSRCTRGEIYLRMNDANRGAALSLFDDAVAIAQERWEAFLMAGWALLDAGWPALAASFLSEAAHLRPRSPNVWLCLGDAFQDLRLYDQALFYYQRVTELEPQHELGIKRQQALVTMKYGLLRALDPRKLSGDWRARFDKAMERERDYE